MTQSKTQRQVTTLLLTGQRCTCKDKYGGFICCNCMAAWMIQNNKAIDPKTGTLVNT